MQADLIGLHAITVVSILIFKVAALIAGVIIVKIGASLLEKGIKGEFKFRSEIKNSVTLDLMGASPGLFFILVGGAIVAFAILQDKPFELSFDPASSTAAPPFPAPSDPSASSSTMTPDPTATPQQ